MDRERLQRLIEERIRQLTLLLYDTRVPPAQVDEEVAPHLAPGVRFTDPWQQAAGRAKYRLGLAGFHQMLRFDFEVAHVHVQLDAAGRTARAVVDGVNQLRLFEPLVTYPLRTILVYDLRVTDPKAGRFVITSHEELWSLADMLAALPLLGEVYTKLFRPGFAWGFLAASWLTGRVRERLGLRAA